MRKSIGAKVYFVLALTVAMFVGLVLSNASALDAIEVFNNNLGNVYMNLEAGTGDMATSFQKVQLYANLLDVKKGTDEEETIKSKLADSIEEMRTNTQTVGTYTAEVGDEALTSSFAAYESATASFLEYTTEVYNLAMDGDFDGAQEMVDTLLAIKTPVQDAEDAYTTLLHEMSASELLHSERRIVGTQIFNNIVLSVYIVLMILTVLLVRRSIISPAKKAGRVLNEIIEKVEAGEGDLTLRVPVTTKDEIGRMAAGINSFVEQLQNIMQKLKDESDSLWSSVETITDKVNDSNETAGSVSAAMEEMAASMEEISATLQQLSTGSTNILKEIQKMDTNVQSGVGIVQDIKSRAAVMHKNTIEGKESTGETIHKIRETLQEALVDSRSVQKINEMTQEILNITSQTNLLSLNASIEAARAGDAGRGFAVVANEIRDLADSSAETANNIQNISAAVTQAVEKLARNAESMLQFIDEKVMKDYDDFVDVVNRYKQDADSVSDILAEFADNTNDINQTMSAMSTGINDISYAVEESSRGVTSVADNAVGIVSAISEIQREAETNEEISKKLGAEVSRFREL